MKYIVTTLRGLEGVVASWLQEKLGAEVELFDRYAGLLRVTVDADQQSVLDAAYEVDRAVPILAECPAELEAIIPAALGVAREVLNPNESLLSDARGGENTTSRANRSTSK